MRSFLAAMLFMVPRGAGAAQDADLAGAVDRWRVSCEMLSRPGDAAALKGLFKRAILQGDSALRRMNPPLAERFELRLKGEPIDLGCGRGVEWNFRAFRHGAGYAVDINEDLLEILLMEVKGCAERNNEPPKCAFPGVKSSMFHELLHFAGFDSVPVELHNHVSSDPQRLDTVVSCALAAFNPASAHCEVCARARLVGRAGTKIADARAERSCRDWAPLP